ncbi:MAG: rhodanese-like domain-containing protein [Hydrogenothermaceae bacterium]
MRKILPIFLAIMMFANLTFANPYVIGVKEAYELLNKEDVIFIDSEDSQTYQKAHIPSAINIDSLSLQDIAIKNNEKQRCKYLPLCPETASKIFSQKGIKNDSLIIIYSSKDPPNKATYLWFLLYSMGHDDKKLKILDGGLERWIEEGLPTESGDEKPLKKSKYKVKPRYEVVATKEDVLKHVKNYENGIDDGTILVDTRTFLEFTGRQDMEGIKRSGHIPGAKFVYWRWFQGKGTTYKPLDKLRDEVKKINLDLNKKIILYCTIGNRSSFVFIPLKALGAKDLRIYTGSWYEWGNDESLPLEKEKYRD